MVSLSATYTHTYSNSVCELTCNSCVLYTYLYCVYALVGGEISICDPYNYLCRSRVCANEFCVPQARCLCSENVAIGFKTHRSLFRGKNSARTPELLEVSKLCHNF